MKKRKIVTRFERMRRIKTILFMFLIAIISMGMGAMAIYFYLDKQIKDNTQALELRKQHLYLAKDTISPGEFLTKDNLKMVYEECSMPREYYISEQDIGKRAVILIETDMPVLRTMCVQGEVTDAVREVSCEVVKLNDNLLENDYVDIRLRLPDGEDYIVLSKKSVHTLSSLEKQQQGVESCYLWMTEEEIVTFSAAIIDAFFYEGSVLYTTKYLMPELQEASLVTYLPRLGTLELIKQNPTLVDTAKVTLKLRLRKDMENRLTEFLTQEAREIGWQVKEQETQKESKERLEREEKIENTSESDTDSGWEEVP